MKRLILALAIVLSASVAHADSTTDIKKIIWTCSWESTGHAPSDRDYEYWLAKWPELVARGQEIGIPDYAERRLLGWQATGADAPKYGPYATPPSAVHEVPPFPDEPPPVPAPPIVAPLPPPVDLAPVLARLDQLDHEVADVKSTMQAEHAEQRNAMSSIGHFLADHWPEIAAAFGAYLTGHSMK